MPARSSAKKRAVKKPRKRLIPWQKPKGAPRGRPFEKGNKPTGGRKKGTPNAVTQASRELVILAAAMDGDQGAGDEGVLKYLTGLRKKSPAIFGAMFARTIDTRVKVEAKVLERVQLLNFTNLDLTNPAVRKRLGPSIFGQAKKGE